MGAERIALSYGHPSVIADRMASGQIDLGLLPIAALAGAQDLELVPGLAVGTFGPSRSVLLVCRRPPAEIDTVALDPESRTSNALARVLLAQVWGRRPTFVSAPAARQGADPLHGCDAAVRIGDKALFDPLPAGCTALDLAQVWTEHTRRPFVFAAWIGRPDVVDPQLYRLLHASSRQGRQDLERIAAGSPQPALARVYLEQNIRCRLGAPEIEALDRVPEIRLALRRETACDVAAEARVR
jgi:chorismate dehydratase